MYTLKLLRSTALLSLILFLVAPTSKALSIDSTGSSVGSPPQPTYTVTIEQTDVGQSFQLDWFIAAADSNATYDLSATGTFIVDSFSDTSLQLSITLDNNTNTGGDGPAGIASLGFGVLPDATASFITAGQVFDGIGSGSGPQQTYPGGFKGVDVCVFAQNCSGGAQNDLLAAGDSDTFTVLIAGDFSGGSAELSSFALKWQTDYGSFEVPGAPVPEPTGALVFGVGLMITAASRRRAA